MRKPYEDSWKLLIGIPKGSLIDFETTGLRPHDSEIITFGYISGNCLKIIQREGGSEEDFLNSIRSDLEGLPQPFYAYNAKFEQKFINYKFGMNAKFIDLIQPWRRKADENNIKSPKPRWPKLGELISEPGEYFGEKIIEGDDVPLLWNEYLKTKNPQCLESIMRHNQIDLLRELVLLIHYRLK